jgi:hypothetical protein
LPNGLFRRPHWPRSPHEKLDPFSASQEAVRELRLTFYCDEAALQDEEREAFQLLRYLAQDRFIECHDWHAHPPKWTLHERGDCDCYRLEGYDNEGRATQTALSDWIRRPMSDTEMLVMIHERFGHDVLVTTDGSLLQLSSATDNANILPPTLALPLAHLYLRSRGKFLNRVADDFQGTFNRGLFYLVLLRALLPELWPFMRTASNQFPQTGVLCSAIRIRCIRALEAQDELGRLYFGQRSSWDDLDRMAYHFDYVTLLLLGAIDAQARIVRQVYGVAVKPKYASYKNENFMKKLRAASAVKICDLVESGVHHDFLEILRTIRNKIHADALGQITYSSPATGDIGLLTLDGEDADTVRELVRQLGDSDVSGIFAFHDPRVLVEPYRCASFLVRKTFSLIAAVAQATEFGVPLLPEPEIPDGPDFFPESNLHNLRLFCKSVAVL